MLTSIEHEKEEMTSENNGYLQIISEHIWHMLFILFAIVFAIAIFLWKRKRKAPINNSTIEISPTNKTEEPNKKKEPKGTIDINPTNKTEEPKREYKKRDVDSFVNHDKIKADTDMNKRTNFIITLSKFGKIKKIDEEIRKQIIQSISKDIGDIEFKYNENEYSIKKEAVNNFMSNKSNDEDTEKINIFIDRFLYLLSCKACYSGGHSNISDREVDYRTKYREEYKLKQQLEIKTDKNLGHFAKIKIIKGNENKLTQIGHIDLLILDNDKILSLKLNDQYYPSDANIKKEIIDFNINVESKFCNHPFPYTYFAYNIMAEIGLFGEYNEGKTIKLEEKVRAINDIDKMDNDLFGKIRERYKEEYIKSKQK